MRSSITHNQFTSEGFMQENAAKQNNSTANSIADLESKNNELEKEPNKQKAATEKGAKLMQMIWGDNFRTDSLY